MSLVCLHFVYHCVFARQDSDDLGGDSPPVILSKSEDEETDVVSLLSVVYFTYPIQLHHVQALPDMDAMRLNPDQVQFL